MSFVQLGVCVTIIVFCMLVVMSIINKKADKQINGFIDVTITEIKNVFNYIVEDKRFEIALILLGIITYGYSISNFSISLDEEFQFAEEKYVDQWCFEGRYNIAILKKIFMRFGMYMPYVATFISAIFIIIAAVIMLMNIEKKIELDNFPLYIKILIVGIFISTPNVIEELMSFSTYSVEVSFAILLAIFSATLCFEYFDNKNKKYMILSFIFTVFSLGIYQALANVYVSMIIILFTCEIIGESKFTMYELKKKFIKCAKIVGWFILELVTFFVIYKIATKIHYVKDSLDYVNGFSGWDFEIGIIGSLKRSLFALINVLKSSDIIGIKYIDLMIIVCFIVAALNVFFQKGIRRLIVPVLISISGLSAFIMWIGLASTSLPFRAWLALPLASAFVWGLFAWSIAHAVKIRLIKIASGFIALLIVFYQVQTLNYMFYSDHVRYEKDITYAENLYFDICECVGETTIADSSIVLIGTKDLADHSKMILKHPSTNLYFGGDALGYSLWRRAQEPRRMAGMFSLLGYDLRFEACTSEDYSWAEKNLNVWPEKGSIKVQNDKIYVRLQ